MNSLRAPATRKHDHANLLISIFENNQLLIIVINDLFKNTFELHTYNILHIVQVNYSTHILIIIEAL